MIGDIVGRPGREIIKANLKRLKDEHRLDFVIANSENASHGFGLSVQHANELFGYGIDLMSGGNHSFDKKEIFSIIDKMPILRPINYPNGVAGEGLKYLQKDGYKLAVINLMGHFGMPMCENPFNTILKIVEELEPCDGIFIDFHAEATSEKNALFAMLKGRVSAIVGTHTHVGTDDFIVDKGSAYLSDIGLTGCRDAVIGMDSHAPIKRFTTGLMSSFDVPNKCKKILQMAVFEFEAMRTIEAYKIKLYDNEEFITKAYFEK